MPTHSFLNDLVSGLWSDNTWSLTPVKEDNLLSVSTGTNPNNSLFPAVSSYTLTIPADKIAITSEPKSYSVPAIREVIFNGTATIVIWADGEKTISRVGEGEAFDRYTGFMACVCKRLFGGTATAKKLMNAKDGDYQQALRDIEEMKAAEKAEAERKAREERAARRRARRREELIRELMAEYAIEEEARKRYEAAAGKKE